jgi:hypothetical protein
MNIEMTQEFDRQVNNLLQKKYPEAAGMSESEFLKLIEPLKEIIKNIDSAEIDLESGKLPFVIVVKSEVINAEAQMSRVEFFGKTGFTKLYPHVPGEFKVIESVRIPSTKIYLMVNIDRGKKYLNVRPQDALVSIQNEGRSPITIDEGIAIITHFPEFLKKNNCYSLLASRMKENKRVPAIWINAKKQPNLGWCWDGNPHTWLGSASCLNRK